LKQFDLETVKEMHLKLSWSATSGPRTRNAIHLFPKLRLRSKAPALGKFTLEGMPEQAVSLLLETLQFRNLERVSLLGEVHKLNLQDYQSQGSNIVFRSVREVYYEHRNEESFDTLRTILKVTPGVQVLKVKDHTTAFAPAFVSELSDWLEPLMMGQVNTPRLKKLLISGSFRRVDDTGAGSYQKRVRTLLDGCSTANESLKEVILTCDLQFPPKQFIWRLSRRPELFDRENHGKHN
jgi:uncharacterized protein (DUF1810 family)